MTGSVARKTATVVPWWSGFLRAGEGYLAAVLDDDAAADPEAKAGALFAFGGEEGLERVCVWISSGMPGPSSATEMRAPGSRRRPS